MLTGEEICQKFLKQKIRSISDKISPESSLNQNYIVKNQIENFNMHKFKRWYSPATILIYFNIFLYSPKAYNFMRKDDFLVAPHERKKMKNI